MGKLETTSVSIGTLAERVRGGGLELPEIQRSFVWNRPQVRDLLGELYTKVDTCPLPKSAASSSRASGGRRPTAASVS